MYYMCESNSVGEVDGDGNGDDDGQGEGDSDGDDGGGLIRVLYMFIEHNLCHCPTQDGHDV